MSKMLKERGRVGWPAMDRMDDEQSAKLEDEKVIRRNINTDPCPCGLDYK